jgi:hypothetical protein
MLAAPPSSYTKYEYVAQPLFPGNSETLATSHILVMWVTFGVYEFCVLSKNLSRDRGLNVQPHAERKRDLQYALPLLLYDGRLCSGD